jgi:hypothetical protein
MQKLPTIQPSQRNGRPFCVMLLNIHYICRPSTRTSIPFPLGTSCKLAAREVPVPFASRTSECHEYGATVFFRVTSPYFEFPADSTEWRNNFWMFLPKRHYGEVSLLPHSSSTKLLNGHQRNLEVVGYSTSSRPHSILVLYSNRDCLCVLPWRNSL